MQPNKRADTRSALTFRNSTYYHNYGYISGHHGHSVHARNNDPNDFQAGDAESLKNEGDDEFETDMNES